MDRTLLLVDDEENIVSSLARLLRSSGYNILRANSGREGLELLASNKIGVIISDQRMPEMTGVEFFSKVKDRHPKTVRIVLSGYADLDAVKEAVNRGAIYKYISKPWDEAELCACVQEAFEHYEQAQRKEQLTLEAQAANAAIANISLDLAKLVAQKDSHIQRISRYDSLTGLPNRQLFFDRLDQELSRALRDERMVAVMAIDLDCFQQVNDSFGHPVADYLLQAVAERLKANVRASDTVARTGGDEFAFILSSIRNAKDAAGVAQKTLGSLAHIPLVAGNSEIFATASMGISIFPSDGQECVELVKNAEAALHSAKKEGRNNFRFYSAEMNAMARQRLTLETELRRALEREEFVLYYQPKVNLATGKVTGMEALLRWQNPERGLVAPCEFISLLEETGLIQPVGEWVLRTVCKQVCIWQESGLSIVPVAVNLSALQFRQSGLAAMVRDIMQENGLDPGSGVLELELTESMLMRNVEEAMAMLRQLHEMGVKLSIDDFGTGYSSLSYLKSFPISSLKIDQSFVRDLACQDGVTVVNAIIALGQGLKLKVIAEGVETEAQLDYLRRARCDEMQGYLFSPPVAAEEMARLLSGEKSSGANRGM
ncbi:MAG: EAL domain-containing protein [Gallionellaceae bacterium]|nr:EAL domain-containing protein [Gallionellaceae bacterium]